MFRALIPVGLPLSHLVARASRIFCESTLPTHYATLVTGRADASGGVEICNAGHLPPLHLRREGRAMLLEATGLPVGIFCNEEFTSVKFSMLPGDTLFLFTDGLSESRGPAGDEYGTERLRSLLCRRQELLPEELINACLGDLSDFCAGSPKHDDLTVMALRRS
jgi:sigma-B regulation protein RsbU (phosphoserine phosphatase)